MKTAQEVINFIYEVCGLKYLAMCEDGVWIAFQEKPVILKNIWDDPREGHYIYLENIQPAEEWTQSLIEAQL